jgi:exoribonuclease II
MYHFRFGQFQIAFFRELLESLGDADTLEAQSKAILMENDIRDEEFTDEVKKTFDFVLVFSDWFVLFQVIKCLPIAKDQWAIPDEEFSKRLDLRQKCIFTIDPATARDLDDALSCEPLENGIVKYFTLFNNTILLSNRTLSSRCSYCGCQLLCSRTNTIGY